MINWWEERKEELEDKIIEWFKKRRKIQYPHQSEELSKILETLYKDGLLKEREETKKLAHVFNKLNLVYWFIAPDKTETYCRGFEARTKRCDIYLLHLPDGRTNVYVLDGREGRAVKIIQKLRKELVRYRSQKNSSI